MASAAILTFWLWQSKSVTQLFGIPVVYVFVALVMTTLAGKTVGAISLMLLSFGLFFAFKITRLRFLLVGLALAGALYGPLRISQVISQSDVMVFATRIFDEERSRSLGFRLSNEDDLAAKALERPLFGWGGWGRNRVVYEGEDSGRRSIPDGMWIIAFSRHGAIGLASITLIFLMPILILARDGQVYEWVTRRGSPRAALTVLLTFYWIDSILNAFANPILIAATGALTGYRKPRNLSDAGRGMRKRRASTTFSQDALSSTRGEATDGV